MQTTAAIACVGSLDVVKRISISSLAYPFASMIQWANPTESLSAVVVEANTVLPHTFAERGRSVLVGFGCASERSLPWLCKARHLGTCGQVFVPRTCTWRSNRHRPPQWSFQSLETMTLPSRKIRLSLVDGRKRSVQASVDDPYVGK